MSRVPHWRRTALAALLGERYHWIQALGNRNYKTGGPVDLLDYPAGLTLIEANPRPVILLCACEKPARCHRTVVGERLRGAGFEVAEVGRLLAQPTQAELFNLQEDLL